MNTTEERQLLKEMRKEVHNAIDQMIDEEGVQDLEPQIMLLMAVTAMTKPMMIIQRLQEKMPALNDICQEFRVACDTFVMKIDAIAEEKEW